MLFRQIKYIINNSGERRNSMDEKTKLRNQLFEKYFEVEEGIYLQDFMKYTTLMKEIWNSLHQLLEKNIKYFDSWSTIEEIKQIVHQEKDYLIVKIRLWDYLIIDLETNQSLSEEFVNNHFAEKFFIQNFNERKVGDKDCLNMYHFEKYNGSTQELIDFFKNNYQILSLPTHLYYQLRIDQAWTYLSINLANSQVQLGFETKDQFLYEHLFINGDLTPSRMQDAIEKIGLDKMQEMFDRIKTMKLPHSVIPEAFYKQKIIPEPSSHKSVPKKVLRKPIN